ncbi:MAG: type II secretion system F family protein [Pirellulales bacterium]
MRSGITLLEGLRTAEELLNNRYLAGRVSAARQAVMQGGTLAEPLAADHAFTPMLARMVAVGESAGTIDDVLDEVARFHEAQLQSAIRRLSAIIEPCIIMVVGGIVGFVYIAFFMALFSAGGA